jgi:hypothetical protein
MKKTNKSGFYFIHTSLPKNGLIDILNDGFIRKGEQLKAKQLGMSDPAEPFDKIFGHIYFDDVKNISHFWGATIIIHPKIIMEQDITIRTNWQDDTHEITIKKTDTESVMKNKLMKIKKMIEHEKETSKKDDIMQHEVLFSKNISIKKYAIGISCNNADDKTFANIKDIIGKKKYKLYVERMNVKLPSLKKLMGMSER